MKNLKKLSRENLKTVKGGLMICMNYDGVCEKVGKFCGEPECKN
ncbi:MULTISPECIES: hypothetical protein [Chryseobacterium]|jgi:hypothetical protein|uniref:Bacteriocin-type signal sequence-containing protein n=1 Tax=Chryseobacterium gambrini TaxID=373672 RepID=A0A1N7N8Q1_9FLAO|nr:MULTISPECIES: hypothetical protein [Chryseobacterium]MDN4011299.1 hypothetical protein [Chryseobacterium gambrini]MDN4031070.1 hypothetical protein [Chryseobacterium gambrini]BEV06312.1 hypothetical protein CRDW_36860 [Chryseobacterium gambrini]SIS94696.1 hypothetical protein SAMN05421785_10463 [Chryseobacterium gambrini]